MPAEVASQHWQGSAPGKILLFGEYGVLYGYPAVVATLPSERLSLTLELTPNPGTDSRELIFESALIPGGIERVDMGVGALLHRFLPDGMPRTPQALSTLARVITPELSRDARFMLLALAPFDQRLPPGRLRIHIQQAFSPALGFGSSSALLGLLHRGLWRLLEPEPGAVSQEYFWMYARTALRLLQGGGSGYDIAVQLAASDHERASLWCYRWDPQGTRFSPSLRACETIPLTGFGLLLETGVYSDTALHVSRFAGVAEAETLAARHGALAHRFLEAPGLECLPELMLESRRIAAAQGILGSGQGPLGALEASLDRAGLPFKSTGAGHGDCLWVLASPDQLERLADPLRSGHTLASRIQRVFPTEQT